MNSQYPFTDLPTIDETVSTPLRNLLGDNYFELVGDFTTDFPTKFKELKKAADNNDIDTIFKVSHTVKSSSGSFGFTRLYKRLEHLELQARNDEISYLSEQIEFIDQEFNSVLVQLEKE